MLEHTEVNGGRPEVVDDLIDLTKLSTPLLRMLQAELRQIEQRESQIAPWNSGTRGTRD